MKEVKVDFILGTAAWLIAPLAAKAEVFPYCWVQGGDGGMSFCPRCVDEEVMSLILNEGEDPDEVWADGGYDWPEEENCRICEGTPSAPDSCGRLLQYTLIDRSGELDHFESLSDDDIKQMSPYSAHELMCVFEGSDHERDREENECRTLTIATRIVALLGHGVVKEIDGVLAAQIMRMDDTRKSNDRFSEGREK